MRFSCAQLKIWFWKKWFPINASYQETFCYLQLSFYKNYVITPVKWIVDAKFDCNFVADISSCQESIGLSDVAIEVLHLLLSYLNTCSKENLNVRLEDKIAFLDSLRRGEQLFLWAHLSNLCKTFQVECFSDVKCL